MKDNSLSDKRIGRLYNDEVGVFYYPEKDVKEFIKDLKEELCKDTMISIYEKPINAKIDKLAGKELK